MELKEAILDLSRQRGRAPLSPWFDRRLDAGIAAGAFLPEGELERVAERLRDELADYRVQAGVGTAVLGMSGGVDSALTAALLRRAGWRVIGFTLPIAQDPDETARGTEACAALGLEHRHLDLTEQYQGIVASLRRLDDAVPGGDDAPERIRRGNVRARLRMVTLYDQAHRCGGLVASTDNFSELAAGFWTLHGDVGDLAPVQSLLKSWEVPVLARALGVPERTWRARPTDGLGVAEGGDEAQIGASYLEWDIMVLALMEAALANPDAARPGDVASTLRIGDDGHARALLAVALRRLGMTWHKRVSPVALGHPVHDRLAPLAALDARLFRPAVLRQDRAISEFGGELPALGATLARRLERAGLRLVTAESCTAGLLAACVADVPGSSGVLEGSIVAYFASMKTDVLGVPADLIARETPYHPSVARQMAAGALDRAPGAGLALSVTGVGGPGPDRGKPAGLVYIGGALRGRHPVVEEHRFEGRPRAILAASIAAALRLGGRLLAQHG